MRIAVDIRSLLSPTGRGVSHYTTALLEEMVKQHPEDQWILVQTGRRPYHLPASLQQPNVQLKHLRLPNKLINLTIMVLRRPRLDGLAGTADVLWAPNLGFIALSPRVPLVLTMHDVSYRLRPEWFQSRERLWHRLVRPGQLIRRASRLVAISTQTAEEIARFYPAATNKITVVPSGVDAQYSQRISAAERRHVRARYQLTQPYFLYMGAFESRKNLHTLRVAFAMAREQGLQAELVLAGNAPTADLGTRDHVRTIGYVTEADKPSLYAEALAAVLVSHHEGFGLPPLEALACGTPSLVADLPVFHENLGPGALFVAPTDSAAMAEKLVHLEQDSAMRSELVKRGQASLKRLTWQSCAAKTYRELRLAAEASDGR